MQQFVQLQQQAAVQATKAYKAAVTSSAKCLQELQDRYFNSTPVQPFPCGKQSSSSTLLKHQRDNIVAAYSDFQQRRGSIESMMGATRNAFGSPFSTLHRKTWQKGSQGISQMAWSQQASLAEGLSRGLNASSRFMDSRKSFAAPVSRTSSGQPSQTDRDMLDGSLSCTSSAAGQRQGLSHQPSQAALGPDVFAPQGSASGSQQLQHDVSLPTQAAGPRSSMAWLDGVSALDSTACVLPEVQPDPSWLSPIVQQTLLFEGCLLNALTALLTQPPSDQQDEQNAAGKRAQQTAPLRQQCWPKAAQDSQQLCGDTTGDS